MIPMHSSRTRAALLVAFALMAVGATAVSAQDPQGPPTPPPTTELVFEREVFIYPSFERRNPFTPLTANSAGGPRFELISLRSVIYSAEPERSLAVFTVGGNFEVTEVGGQVEVDLNEIQSRRLRVGESWGNMRLVEVQRDRVVVEVTEFRIRETHVMMLPRAGQGGS